MTEMASSAPTWAVWPAHLLSLRASSAQSASLPCLPGAAASRGTSFLTLRVHVHPGAPVSSLRLHLPLSSSSFKAASLPCLKQPPPGRPPSTCSSFSPAACTCPGPRSFPGFPLPLDAPLLSPGAPAPVLHSPAETASNCRFPFPLAPPAFGPAPCSGRTRRPQPQLARPQIAHAPPVLILPGPDRALIPGAANVLAFLQVPAEPLPRFGHPWDLPAGNGRLGAPAARVGARPLGARHRTARRSIRRACGAAAL